MHPQFQVRILNSEGIEKAQRIAQLFDVLLTQLEEVMPEGRETSIVKTKLEEACFYAKKSVANDPINRYE